MATQGLQYDIKQASADSGLTEQQLINQGQTPGAVSLDQMSPVVPITLPQAMPDSGQADALISGVQAGQKTLQDYISQATPQTTEADRQNQSILDQIASLTEQSVGKDQALAQAQQTAGAPELLKQQSELAGQIAMGNASYAQLQAKEQADLAKAEATSRSAFDYAGSTGAIQRQFLAEKATKAAEIGMLAARQQAVAGNLQTALTIAQNAVNAKYGPIEDDLKVKQAQLQALQPTLNKQEKIQALALERQYNDQQQQIADKKDREKQINTVMLEASKFGADPQTLAKIQASGSVGEAIANSGSFLSAEFKQKVEQQKFENNLNLQQLAISRANYALAARKQELEELKATGLGDVNQLTALAAQYAATGAMPTQADKAQYGAIATIAKELPKDTGTLVDKNTGTIPSAMKSGTRDGVVALYDLTQKLAQAKSLFNTLQSTGQTGVLGGTVGRIFPSTEAQAYDSLKGEITDLLARARTGAAITAYEEKQYADKLPGYFNKTALIGASGTNKIDNLQKSLEGKLNATLNINNSAIYGYSKVNLEGKTYTVGDIISNGQQQARVNPDGTLTIIQ